MTRLSVLIVVHSEFPADPRIRKQAQALRAAGIDVSVLCLREPGQEREEVWQGVRVRRLPVKRHRGGGAATYLLEYLTFFLMSAAWLALRAWRLRPSVVQVATLPDPLVFAALPARLTGSRILLDLHELMPEFLETRFERPPTHPLIRIARGLEQASCAFADHVLTVSEPLRRVLIGRGVPPGHVDVVMNTAPLSTDMGRDAGDAPTDGRPFTFVYHGLVSDLYDLPLVIDAIGLLRREGWNVRLRVIGDGPELPRLRERAADLGAGVVFDGRVEPERIPVLLRECDAGVIPLADRGYARFALPTKLFECVARGMPVVTTRMPTIEHYFRDDAVSFATAGDAHSLAAAMRRFRDEPDHGRAMGARGREAARAIEWSVMAERYVDTVRRVAAAAPESSRAEAAA